MKLLFLTKSLACFSIIVIIELTGKKSSKKMCSQRFRDDVVYANFPLPLTKIGGKDDRVKGPL